MNRHLKRILISFLVAIGVNGFLIAEEIGSSHETWHYKLMELLYKPIGIIADWIVGSGHPNSLMEALLPFILSLTLSLTFYTALAWVGLTRWHWMRTGKV
jgi:hypothetical protein